MFSDCSGLIGEFWFSVFQKVVIPMSPECLPGLGHLFQVAHPGEGLSSSLAIVPKPQSLSPGASAHTQELTHNRLYYLREKLGEGRGRSSPGSGSGVPWLLQPSIGCTNNVKGTMPKFGKNSERRGPSVIHVKGWRSQIFFLKPAVNSQISLFWPILNLIVVLILISREWFIFFELKSLFFFYLLILYVE